MKVHAGGPVTSVQDESTPPLSPRGPELEYVGNIAVFNRFD